MKELRTAPFFNQVTDGEIWSENIALAQFADTSTGFFTHLALGGFI
jgi:hypothetical protein